MLDGRTIKSVDPRYSVIEWLLRFDSLTIQELNNIHALFETVEGPLKPFTFVAPTGNLLLRSQEFSATAWTRGAALLLQPEEGGPPGSETATVVVNPSPVSQLIEQTAAVPGDYRFSFSLWVKSDLPTIVTLLIDGHPTPLLASSEWVRLNASGSGTPGATSVTFGVAFQAETAVSIYGAHVATQTNPSAYRRTFGRSAIYHNTYFATDSISVTAMGKDRNSLDLTLVSID